MWLAAAIVLLIAYPSFYQNDGSSQFGELTNQVTALTSAQTQLEIPEARLPKRNWPKQKLLLKLCFMMKISSPGWSALMANMTNP